MSKKYTIQVRKVDAGFSLYDSSAPFTVVESVQRAIRSEAIGNFNPCFCSYKEDRRCLVHSEQGDMSDPFRREDSYLTTLYIRIH